MPAITAVPVPVPGYVYVETDWSDIPAAASVCVDRVDVATGERFPLRPYVSYTEEGCLDLSCGLGIFWDTEASFDTPYQYCATAANAAGTVFTAPAAPLVTDTFSRVVAASWGTATSGQAWTATSGAAADHSVNGARGIHTTTVTNTVYEDTINAGSPNGTVSAQVQIPAVALTSGFDVRLEGRRTDANNYYSLLLTFNTTGAVDGQLVKLVAGVQTFFTPVTAGTYTAGSLWNMSFTYWGSQLSAFWYDATTPAPSAPLVTATDTALVSGSLAGLRTRRNAGNTNGALAFGYDNFLFTGVCADPVVLEVCSGTVVVPGDGCFRLGDPVRPCSDQHVCLGEESDCSAEEVGIYFGTMTPGRYADNSGQLLPVNARRPIVVSRERRDVQSQLTLVTRTFGDRDDVLDLAQPGTPLLWRGPASYGTGDRYMSVLDVDLSQSFLDLQQEPRVIALPHWAVDPVVGPSLGICGTRVADLCDVYPTWTGMAAGGLSYADILRGLAGTGTAVALADWNDVNADFASWNALNAGETDWDDTLQGSP